MKMVKSLILGSAAALVAMSGAQAADLPVKAKAVEYVRICSLYGAGFYYIPGTDTCIKLGGYLRVDAVLGSNSDYAGALNGVAGAHNRLSNYFTTRSRADFNIDTRTATEYGVLRTYWDSVFTWTNGSRAGSDPSTYAGDGIAGGSLGVYHAFIQFAGFTMGKTVSIFDAPWQSYPAGGPDSLPGGSNHVTGVNQFTYTAQFGNGVSGSLSAQNPTGYDETNVFNLSSATAAGMATGVYGASSFGGTRAPDLIAQIRVDQAWGLFQLSGVAHQSHVAYYGATEPTGHPDSKWGFAVQAALSIKNIPTGPGDSINLQAVYTDGASRYNFQSLMPTNYAMYSGTGLAGAYQSIGIAGVADTVFVDGSDQETVKTWGFRGGYTHNWSPNWASGIYGAYAQLRYGNGGAGVICGNMAVLLAHVGTCNPDFNMGVVGVNTVWKPVKGLAFTADFHWARLDQKHDGTIVAPALAAIAKPAAVYELKDQNSFAMLLRAQRNW
jgi:hypothetical protein